MDSEGKLREMIDALRVVDLKDILDFAGEVKQGKKAQLKQRVLNLLKSKSLHLEQKIIEVTRLRFDNNSQISNKLLTVNKTQNMNCESIQHASNCEAKVSNVSNCDAKVSNGSNCGAKASNVSNCDAKVSNVSNCVANFPYVPNCNAKLPHVSNCNAKLPYAANCDAKLVYADPKCLPSYECLDVLLQETPLYTNSANVHQFHRWFAPPADLQRHLIQKEQYYCAVSNSFLRNTQVQLRVFVYEKGRYVNNRSSPLIRLEVNNEQVYSPLKDPINITRLCDWNRSNPNHIWLAWKQEKNCPFSYSVAIHFVRFSKISFPLPELERLGTTSEDFTKRMLKIMFEKYESDIYSTSMKVSLLCPITKVKIETPCRSMICKHIQCFDARSYLSLNRMKPLRLCPVCNGNAPILMIDGFFLQIIREIPYQCTEIILSDDGSWKAILPEEKRCIDQGNSAKFQPKIIDLTDEDLTDCAIIYPLKYLK